MSYGGCLGKVDSQALVRLLSDAGMPGSHRNEFFDAGIVAVGSEVQGLAVSSDLVYDFGCGAADFGRIASVHAMSDIYAVLGVPLFATISLGTPRSSLDDGSAAAIIGGARDALNEAGAVLCGGHTVYSGQSLMAVSVVGSNPLMPQPILAKGKAYRVLLSKPLGSGVYIAAWRNRLLRDGAISELLGVQRRTNADASRSLAVLEERSPGALGFVTDISGFGLLISLYGKVGSGWQAQIDVSAVPSMRETRSLIEQHGVATGLGEQNMIWARDDPDCDVSSVAIADLLLASDPQTSGGILAAVSQDSSPLDPDNWFEIGVLSTASNANTPRIKLVSTKGSL